MTRAQLHEIAVRRRGDPDVKALLLEIKRLHGVLVQANDLVSSLPPYPDNLNGVYANGDHSPSASPETLISSFFDLVTHWAPSFSPLRRLVRQRWIQLPQLLKAMHPGLRCQTPLGGGFQRAYGSNPPVPFARCERKKSMLLNVLTCTRSFRLSPFRSNASTVRSVCSPPL